MAIEKININDTQDKNYAEFDLGLLCEEAYAKLKHIDMVAYTLLKNQQGLSLKTTLEGKSKRFVDKYGNVFVNIGQDKLCKLLRTSRPTLIASLKRLEDAELIQVVAIGNMKCNRIYVGRIKRTTTLGEYISKMNIEEVEEDFELKIEAENIENKKAPSDQRGTKETKKQSCTDSICNNKDNNTSKRENKEEKNVSEVEKLIEDSWINIRKEDIKKCIETFEDIDKLKEAIKMVEERGSHGFKVLAQTYDNIGKPNKSNSNKFKNFDTQGTKGYTDDQLLEMNRKYWEEKVEVINNFKKNS